MRKPKQAMQEWFDGLIGSDNLATAISSFEAMYPDFHMDEKFMVIAFYFFCCGSANCMTRSEFDRLMGKDD